MVIRAGLIFGLLCIAPGFAAAQLIPLEPGILKALNQLRADPARYAAVLRQQRQYYRGNILAIPGQTDLLTREGVRPLDEAIADLRSMRGSLGLVSFATGLSRAAADHARDTGSRGITGHFSTDGSDFSRRIERYGTWSGAIGEDISYGAREAREVIADLLIDDGVANRAHRKSLLDPRWRYVGIACSDHARYRTVCVLDLASGYQTR
jgi:uncharacterized protein YkwD